MTSTNYELVKYVADEGKVFDWIDLSAHTHEETIVDEQGEEKTIVVQEHLYAKTLFIGDLDTIDNYQEVDSPSA